MDRRALYNSLRINWKLDPSLRIQTWQVEDLRIFPIEELFKRLEQFSLQLDRAHFLSLVEAYDSPEELSDHLTDSEDPEVIDQIFLIVFELWRRLAPEKQSLSLFCDELDYQIEQHDTSGKVTTEGIEDAINHLSMLLEDNVEGVKDPYELFNSIAEVCSHDIEGFLYDYIASLIEHQNFSYAEELIEKFDPYLKKDLWFEFLKVQLLLHTDAVKYHEAVKELIKKGEDLDFLLELLVYLSEKEDEKLFQALAKKIMPLLRTEEEFQDYLKSHQDFYHAHGNFEKEQQIISLLKNRSKLSLEASISKSNLREYL